MLLLTDRLDEGRRLQHALNAVEPCTLMTLDHTGASSASHVAVLCDAALSRPSALAVVRSVVAQQRISLGRPVLLLSRRAGADALAEARAVQATAVMPHTSSHAQVLFTVRRLIEVAQSGASRARAIDPEVRAGVERSGAVLVGAFEAARHRRPIDPASLDQGVDAVLAAVGGGRIGAWLDVVRTYDNATYQHCLLVAGLAAGFAARLGVTLKGQRLITRAALVHDIGKASIPHVILNKAGPLTIPEMTVMRSHAMIGHDMLARQGGYDPQLLDIVRHHHEYVDGSGYPDALGGAQVKPLTRLLTICDIYAALTERRPYKAQTPPQEALSILAGMAGKLDTGLLRSFHGLVAAP